MARRLWADLNDIDESGHVVSTVSEAEPGVVLEAGAEVLAGNDEGDLWRMRVVSVDGGGWVRLELVSTVRVAPLRREPGDRARGPQAGTATERDRGRTRISKAITDELKAED